MKIDIPATSANLGAGFDCLGLALRLYNSVEIRPSAVRKLTIKGEGEDNPKVKKNNFFVSVFEETFRGLTGKSENFAFIFDNQIPFSRGLGSSSAVIIGAIASAYHIAGFDISRQNILNKALIYESHPDNIAPCALGGMCVNVVHGQQVITKKFEISRDIVAVVVIPDVPMSTNQSRAVLPATYPIKDVVCNISHASFVTACFASGDYSALRDGAHDAVHESARMSTLPELFAVRETAYANGSLFSTLSGSGSSFLNIAYRDECERLAQILRQKFANFRVEILEFDNDGFVIQSQI